MGTATSGKETQKSSGENQRVGGRRPCVNIQAWHTDAHHPHTHGGCPRRWSPHTVASGARLPEPSIVITFLRANPEEIDTQGSQDSVHRLCPGEAVQSPQASPYLSPAWQAGRLARGSQLTLLPSSPSPRPSFPSPRGASARLYDKSARSSDPFHSLFWKQVSLSACNCPYFFWLCRCGGRGILWSSTPRLCDVRARDTLLLAARVMLLSATYLPYVCMYTCAGESVLSASITYQDQPKGLHAHNLCFVCTCVSQGCFLVRVSLGVLVCASA